MSRTDKTNPWWVKGRDHVVEVHDHRNGICELADVDINDSESWGWDPKRCHFDAEWWHGEMNCPCWMCHYGWDAPVRSTEKQKWRREIND